MKVQKYFKPEVVLSLFLVNFKLCNSANILFFFGLSTYSHRLIAWPLVEALLERNHTVTFFQPDKNKNPNPKVKEVNPEMDGISDQVNFMEERLRLGHRRLLFKVVHILPELGGTFCEMFLSKPEIVQWIKSSKYDLIIIDGLFNECAYGIAHLHQAKTIIFSTSHPFGWYPDSLGYLVEDATVPDLHFSFDIPLSFIDRVWTTLATLQYHAMRSFLYFPRLERILREKLDMPGMPPIAELVANTSAVFTNTHFSEELGRSLPPNIIPIGGMNCKEKSKLKPIPKDILEFINGAGDDGFIVISFGSGAKISSAPKELQLVFFKALEKIKTRVVWKWEGERPKEMPPNVMTKNWIPLQEILAHPRVRLLIFHGGLLSMHEAICHQVPQIVFPVFAEQDFNGDRLQRTERGLRLDITTITLEKLADAIKQVLYDERYKQNIVKVSNRFMDRPMKPVDVAVFWTEYVLRQPDTSFMRPTGAHLTWYQRRLLDVWAFLLIISLLIIFISLKVLRFLGKTLVFMLTGRKQSGKVKRS